jgi:transposase
MSRSRPQRARSAARATLLASSGVQAVPQTPNAATPNATPNSSARPQAQGRATRGKTSLASTPPAPPDCMRGAAQHTPLVETFPPHDADDPATATEAIPIGVGIDTSRYGHHVAFLRGDLQLAAADLKVIECAAGYQQLRQRLERIAANLAPRTVHFHMRLDRAGRYADNLLAFLQDLPVAKTLSCGDPERNKNYRAAIYGNKKSDPIEAHACARYALTEKPRPTPTLSDEMRLLCQIASRLESQAKQNTRLINQLHNLLSRTFPELALLIKDISAGWVLSLLTRYPTAAKLAKARAAALERIPYLPHEHIPMLLEHARSSVASLCGAAAEALVRDLVEQVKQAHVRHKSLEKLLTDAYRRLPFDNHLATIKGFGEVTAAILTAKIVDPDRFAEPAKLVGFFGAFPVEKSSGVDREGKRRAPVRMVMSKRGNDLVRRYLWMASLSASQHNPAARALFQRVRARHPNHGSIAIGHVMRKLLHIALAVWQSGKPFDPEHYPWEATPATKEDRGGQEEVRAEARDVSAETRDNVSATEPSPAGAASAALSPTATASTAQTAPSVDPPGVSRPQKSASRGPQNPDKPGRSVVTAAGRKSTRRAAATPETPPAAPAQASATTPPSATRRQTPPRQEPVATSAAPTADGSDIPMSLATASAADSLWIDFAHLRGQLPLARLLDHLGLSRTLRGQGRQRRGPCPLHAPGESAGRTFSVHLDRNVFQCFDPRCGQRGDIIDLYAALKGLPLRAAAAALIASFHLEAAPRTEKRHG